LGLGQRNKKLKNMKKLRFLTMIATFAVMFAGCEETYQGGGNGGNGGSSGLFSNDCYCEVSSDMVSAPLYDEGEPTIVDFEGDCSEATCYDLPAETQELWPCEDLEAMGLTLTCW
jgi:hypothetical protein